MSIFMNLTVTLVGHPYAPIGMGEHIRAVFRALKSVNVSVNVRDVYGIKDGDEDLHREFEPYLKGDLAATLNIFCLNGDEVEPSLSHLQLSELPKRSYNIIYPAWELSKYPSEWAKKINSFDEVWTTSKFTHDSIKASVNIPVCQMPLACEISLNSFLDRRFFGIPESAFVLFFSFDFTSYILRKNPFAVLEAFKQLCNRCPDKDLFLVIKLNNSDARKGDYNKFIASFRDFQNRILIINKLFTDNEIKNLIRCCDCFISLHRSEGYGLGIIAAMYLGKPVVATAYSGNLDYMTPDNSCLVRYTLCNVAENAYPFYQGQVWAEPDISHAVEWLVQLVSNRDFAQERGRNANRHIRTYYSHRAIGLKYLNRITNICS